MRRGKYWGLILLPKGSEEREVLGVGSISVAILHSCQDMKTVAILLPKHKYSWVVKIRNTSEDSGHNTPLGHHTDGSPIGIDQYSSPGEYYHPHTASSVFLIVLVPVL